MKKGLISLICLGLLPLLVGSTFAQTDPLIEEMVAAVSQTRLTSSVQTLQDFQTRHTYTQANTDAGNWLFDQFAALGITVEFHSFSMSGNTEVNVIARIEGSTLPDEIVAISGHFDSTSNQPTSNAPGADDDASAIAAILEAALIFRDYRFERTIEFMCFNGEEQGRRGSAAIATDYNAADKNLYAVVNNDMIGYWPTGWSRDLDVAYEPISEWLADRVIAASDAYVGIPIDKHPSGVCHDDHYAFTQQGISAITNMDCWQAHNGGQGGESTPHYHRTTDTLSTLNMPCMTQAVQVNIAAVADLAGPLETVGVGDAPAQAAHSTLRLLGNQPNPFNPTTEIHFSSATAGDWLELRVYSAGGVLLRTIEQGAYSAGPQSITWDGLDNDGKVLPSGIYLYQLASARGASETGKAVLLK